jgi:diacylglycerol O-acyltransferase
MKILGPMDMPWLYLESADTPMHFSILMTFEAPAGSPTSFVNDLATSLAGTPVRAPWNLRLGDGTLGRYGSMLFEDPAPDLAHHIQRHTLGSPGTIDGLLTFVADLHSTGLDMTRPLWECHVVDGFADGRFALFLKIHHGLLDGSSSMRLVMGMLSSREEERGMLPAWAKSPNRLAAGATPQDLAAQGSGREENAGLLERTTHLLQRSTEAARSLTCAGLGLTRGILQTASAVLDKRETLTVPYAGDTAPFGGRLTAARTVEARGLDLERLRKTATAGRCTVNEFVLYLIGTALRRYLIETNQPTDKSLTAAVPVNLREEEEDERLGNVVAQIYVDLHTDLANPRRRLRAVQTSATTAKSHINVLPSSTRSLYTLAAVGPYVLGMVAGLGGEAPVPYSLNVSNVPGPSKALYFNGARMVDFCPVAFLMHGGALCILCTSYDGRLILSLTGARDQFTGTSRIADLLVESFEEAEVLLSGH